MVVLVELGVAWLLTVWAAQARSKSATGFATNGAIAEYLYDRVIGKAVDAAHVLLGRKDVRGGSDPLGIPRTQHHHVAVLQLAQTRAWWIAGKHFPDGCQCCEFVLRPSLAERHVPRRLQLLSGTHLCVLPFIMVELPQLDPASTSFTDSLSCHYFIAPQRASIAI